MIPLGLEVVYPPPGESLPAKYLRQFDIVFIHGLGRDSIKTWHHETTGKTWISDPDFLGSLSLSARVFTYTYNSELAANMSSASIGLHASELLELMTIYYNQSGGGPTIFVAHGFGGIIVKKAIEMYSTVLTYRSVEDTAAGVVFLGTPHSTTDTDALLKVLKATAALHTKHGSKPSLSGMRDYVVSVRDTNAALRARMIDKLEIGNLIEKLPTSFGLDDSEAPHYDLVVPSACSKFRAGSHQMMHLDCDHLGLASYPSPTDPNFRQLHTFLTIMSNRAKMNVKSRVGGPMMAPPLLSSNLAPPGPPRPPGPGPPPMPMPSPSPPPPYGEKIDDDKRILLPPPGARMPMRNSSFQDWVRKKDIESIAQGRNAFAKSLSGWAQSNTGSHVLPIPGSCPWIRSNDSFKLWLDGPQSTALLCHGRPGCGKTHWAKSIANFLEASRQGDLVLSFFCDRARTGSNEPAILESFLHQIMSSRPEWYREIPSQYAERRPDAPRLTMESLSDILLHIKRSRSMSTVFFIIDAIDECNTDYTRKFLRHVSAFVDRFGLDRSLAGTNPHQDEPGRVKFKFLFTSRLTDVVRVAPCFTGASPGSFSATDEDIKADISAFVDMHFDRLKEEAGTDGVDLIKSRIKEQAGTFFTFAASSCAEVAAGASPSDCPESLARYYDTQTLPLLQSVENTRYCLEALCIAGAMFPSSVSKDELLDALNRIHDHDGSRLVASHIWPMISEKCSRLFDVSSGSLRLTHQSFHSYFLGLVPVEALQAYMAKACLNYLSRSCFASKDLPPRSMPWKDARALLDKTYPFYKIAATRWRVCLSESGDEAMNLLGTLQGFLLEHSPQYRTWCLYMAWDRTSWDPEVGIIHPCRAILPVDLIDLIRPFLPTAWGIVGRHLSPVSTPGKRNNWTRRIQWGSLLRILPTSREHHQPVFSDDVCDGEGMTPLHASCNLGVKSALTLFLSCPLDVNQRTYVSGETALFTACKRYPMNIVGPDDAIEHLGLVRLLLEAGANPNIPTRDGTTCLHMACKAGKLELVNLLLQYGAEVNVCDLQGRSVLEATAQGNRLWGSGIPVLERLIEAGIDLDARYSDYDPPISSAIAERQIEFFEILVQHVSDVNQHDNEGLAPIHQLIQVGRSDLLPYLLGRPDVQLDALCKPPTIHLPSETALSFAVSKSDIRAAQLLLAAGASPGYVPGMQARLPLCRAVRYCESSLVQLLLQYGAPVNEIEKDAGLRDRTALATAIASRKEGFVRLLLDHGADPTTEEAYGLRSPLIPAVRRGDVNTIRMLLENVVPPDINYRTARQPHVFFEIQDDKSGLEIARLLLEHDADIKSSYDSGDRHSPLHCMIADGLVEVSKILIEHDPSLLDLQHENGLMNRTPLHWAACENELEAVLYLIKAGARVDTTSFWYNDTAFGLACTNGRLEVAKVLYDAAPQFLEHRIYNGSTPLLEACANPEISIAKFLLEKGADPRAMDSTGASCVRRALWHDDQTAIQLIRLLVKHGLGPNEVVGSDRLTVLGEACRMGTMTVVKYLLANGGDPLRCQPTWDGSHWRTALHVAVVFKEPKVVELLLQRADVREHIAHTDWAGENVLFINPLRPRTRENACQLFWATEEMRQETGHDIFTEMATSKSLAGETAVDIALHGPHLFPSPQALPNIKQKIREYVTALIPATRSLKDHGLVIDHLAYCLSSLDRKHDEQAIMLAQTFYIVENIEEKEDHYKKGPRFFWECDRCSEPSEALHLCRFCYDSLCPKCLEAGGPGVHDFMIMPLTDTVDIHTEEFQGMLNLLATEFDVDHVDEGGDTVPPVQERPFREDPASAATTLSLATLHAFGYLEFQRRAWSPYIGLARAVYERIEPWNALIQDQRDIIRDRVLDIEVAPSRLRGELAYFLGSGRRMAYEDEEAIRYGWVLEAIGICFQSYENRSNDSVNDGGDNSDDVEIVW